MELDHYFDEVEALSLSNKKIVLLEDCINKQAEISEICLDLSENLSLNIELEYYDNANKALEMVITSPPDLLIVDWRLPGSMDGISFIKLVRQKCSTNIPILFFTDFATPETRLQSLKSKATVFFDKAEATDLFIAQIESLLNLSNTDENDITLSNNAICTSVTATELKTLLNFHLVAQNNYRADINIQAITATLDIDEKKLRHIIKKYLNVSAQKYLTFYRMYLASQLLQKQCSVKETTSCLGYSNTANFSNVFKTTYQISPAQYQKNYQV